LVTDEESVRRLTPEAEHHGYEVFAGDPDDVLDRYCRAAEYFRVDTIVRATGDNPLTSGKMAQRALDLFLRTKADYAGISGTPYGTGVEVLSVRGLKDVRKRSTDPYEHEHVSPGLYRDPERYKVVIETAPEDLTMPDLRVTLDTPSDYEYIADVFRNVYRGTPIEIPDLIAYAQRHQKHSA
jgi:spore coat polysaccharide biosynthesis protein SpsF